MTKLRKLWRTRRRGRQMERDLNDELKAYVEDLTARDEARGLPPPDAARRAALVEVGGVTGAGADARGVDRSRARDRSA